MASRLTDTSKFLSFVLRHKPDSIGLSLDSEGWVDIDKLIEAAGGHGRKLDRTLIRQVVETNDKKRFATSGDGLRIRALQGHSTASVAISHVERTPPKVLYHGTATRFLNSILAEGLRPGTRHHVHLSSDAETATAVGARHGQPVVLRVNAESMHAEGHSFYLSENGVWLTDCVPPSFLERVG